MNHLLEKVLNNVSLDPRIKDGIFSIEENSHMDVLREYFIGKGIDEEMVKEYCNMIIEGKYPERQAYNQKGILVTFPTPEYKQRSIDRGTHFEQDPTKGKPNIFSDPQSKTPQQSGQSQSATNLPLSQATGKIVLQPDTPKNQGQETPIQEPSTTAAPLQVSTTPKEPIAKPEDPAPSPPPKSPAEKEADKNAIKQILRGDDYMLEEVIKYMSYNAPHFLEDIKKSI